MLYTGISIEKTQEAFREMFNAGLVVGDGDNKYYKISFLKQALYLYLPYDTVKKHEEIIKENNFFFGDIFFINEGFVYINYRLAKQYIDIFRRILRYDVLYFADDDSQPVTLTGGKDIAWILQNPEEVREPFYLYRASYISIAPRYYSYIVRPDHVVKEYRNNYDFGLGYVSVWLDDFSESEESDFKAKLNRTFNGDFYDYGE